MAPSARVLFCAGLLLVASAVFTAFFAFSAAMLVRLTPVYRPITCTLLPGKLVGAPSFDDGWINVTGLSQKRCSNPNSYRMSAREKAPGSAFAMIEPGSRLKAIGDVKLQPFTLEQEGEVITNTTMQVHMRMGDNDTMSFMEAAAPRVVTEEVVQTEVEIGMLGRSFRFGMVGHRICGFAISPLERKVGHANCVNADDFGGNRTAAVAALTFPDVDEERGLTQEVVISDELFRWATRRRDAVLGASIGVSGGLALASLAAAVILLRRCGAKLQARECIEKSKGADV